MEQIHPGSKAASVRSVKHRDRPGLISGAVFVLLIAIPVFANLSFGAASSGAFAAVMLLMIPVPLLWLAHALRKGAFRIPTEPMQLAFLGLIMLGIFQLLPLGDPGVPAGVLSGGAVTSLSLDPNATRLAIVRLFVFWLFFAAALTFVDSVRRVRAVTAAVIVYGSLAAFFAVLQFLADPSMIYGLTPAAQARPFGSYINQHHFASFLVMTISPAVALLAGGGVKRDKIVFLLIAVLLMGTGIIFTGSRGAFLSFLAVLAFLAVWTLVTRNAGGKKGKSRRGRSLVNALVTAGAAAGLLALLFLVAVWAGGEQGLMRGAGMQAGDDFSTGRLHFWSVAWKIFLANPVTGAGLESFGNAFTRYDTMSGMYRLEHAHNEYLQMLADGGAVGFLIAFSFIVFLFRGGIRTIRSSKDRFIRSVSAGALAGCFGVLVHSFVDFPLRTNANMFFFLLLAAVCATKKE